MHSHGGSTYNVCGVPIRGLTPREAAEQIVGAAGSRTSLEAHLCNAYTLSLVDSDAELRAALQRADLNLPDGTPVAWLGRRRGASGPVRGPGLVGDVVDLGRKVGLRHYFFGAAPGVADAMASNLRQRFPGVMIAGVESPPFVRLSDEDLAQAAARMNSAEASVIWIGLGTPSQDYLVPRLSALVEVPVIPIGAAFDFWAGTVPQAPAWLHGSGLEWIHRLATEPRRLWRRYLIGNPKFVRSTLRHARRAKVTS